MKKASDCLRGKYIVNRYCRFLMVWTSEEHSVCHATFATSGEALVLSRKQGVSIVGSFYVLLLGLH